MARRIIVATLVLIFTLAVLSFSTFGSSAVCAKCGCYSSAIDFQLPLIPITYWRSRTIDKTRLSTTCSDLGFRASHSHDWKLIHGGGNGILCALGSGGDLYTTARSAEVAQFLVDTARYRGRDEASDWFQTALTDRTSRALLNWINLTAFPKDGFQTAEDYDAWRQRADPEWSDLVQRNASRWGDANDG